MPAKKIEYDEFGARITPIPGLPFFGLIRIDTVLAYYQVSKAQLYQEISEGNFPKQIKRGYSSFWDAHAFREFLRNAGAIIETSDNLQENQKH